MTCFGSQIVRPNFEEDLAQCVTSVNQCPGAFNVNCPDEDVGNDFDQNNCACNDQVRNSFASVHDIFTYKGLKQIFSCRFGLTTTALQAFIATVPWSMVEKD
jgi:hypothetical protein